MYTPASFKISDWSVVASFIRKHSFGTLLTIEDGRIHDTRAPFILSDDENFLWGHIARANPHWSNWGQSTAGKILFSGPHCYVSPTFYTTDFNVPTWNYVSASISGLISIVDAEEQVLAFLESLVSRYEEGREGQGWAFDVSDERYIRLLAGIVVFKVRIEEIDASFKLNQNKSKEDQESVIQNLSKSRIERDRQIATLMRRHFEDRFLLPPASIL